MQINNLKFVELMFDDEFDNDQKRMTGVPMVGEFVLSALLFIRISFSVSEFVCQTRLFTLYNYNSYKNQAATESNCMRARSVTECWYAAYNAIVAHNTENIGLVKIM